MTLIKLAVDGALALQWVVISGYFVRRYALHRRLISLAIAAMCLGWAAIGCAGVIVTVKSLAVDPSLTAAFWPIKLAALALGAFVAYTVIRVERTGK